VKVAFVDRRDNRDALSYNIGPESTPGNLQRLFMDLTSPRLDRQYGLHLHNRKVRDQASRPWLLEYAVHEFGAALLAVAFRQQAGIEEVVWQSALLPKSNHGVGKGTGDRRQRSPHLIQADIIMRCFGPFLGREVSGDVLAHGSRAGDGHSHLLPVFERHGLQRLENAVLI
jgi:hypothetical protein